jgi:hypothetical protein
MYYVILGPVNCYPCLPAHPPLSLMGGSRGPGVGACCKANYDGNPMIDVHGGSSSTGRCPWPGISCDRRAFEQTVSMGRHAWTETEQWGGPIPCGPVRKIRS